jgi:hypothetical protein
MKAQNGSLDKPQLVGYSILTMSQRALQLWEWSSRIWFVADCYYMIASISGEFPVWWAAPCDPKCALRAADLVLITQCIWKLRPDLVTAASAMPWVVDTFEFVGVRYGNIKERLLPIKMHGFSAGSYASKKKRPSPKDLKIGNCTFNGFPFQSVSMLGYPQNQWAYWRTWLLQLNKCQDKRRV